MVRPPGELRMKRFIAVIVAATVIGGFVGAELMDSSFSITGAVGGGVGTAAILLGLGAFFDAQERKRKEKLLPPEMRAVFDRMLDKNTSSRQQHPKPTPRQQTQRTAPPEKKTLVILKSYTFPLLQVLFLCS